MRPPTNNPITQTMHGQFNAVDYSYLPDINIYAPEDGEITTYTPSGDCGNNLQMKGASGSHGFCHLEQAYVFPGQKVDKGQKLGKMGYTGRTIPVGPEGRHLHWVLKLSDGTYVYPPTKVTEPFGSSQGEDDMVDDVGARVILGALGILAQPGNQPDRQPTLDEVKNLIGKPYKQAIEEVTAYQPYKNNLAKIKYYEADIQALDKKIEELRKTASDPKSQEIISDLQQVIEKYKG